MSESNPYLLDPNCHHQSKIHYPPPYLVRFSTIKIQMMILSEQELINLTGKGILKMRMEMRKS